MLEDGKWKELEPVGGRDFGYIEKDHMITFVTRDEFRKYELTPDLCHRFLPPDHPLRAGVV